MTKRETAAERRDREAHERAEKEMCWQSGKHRRMMVAIARAQELGFEVRLETMGICENDVRVEFIDRNCQLHTDTTFFTMHDMNEWKMVTLENDLIRILKERDVEAARVRRRQELLDRLSPEERELLGV